MRATSHRFLFICEQRHSVGKGWSEEGKALFDCLPWMISSIKQRQVLFTIYFSQFVCFMTEKKRKMTPSSKHNMDMILKRGKTHLAAARHVHNYCLAPHPGCWSGKKIEEYKFMEYSFMENKNRGI